MGSIERTRKVDFKWFIDIHSNGDSPTTGVLPKDTSIDFFLIVSPQSRQ